MQTALGEGTLFADRFEIDRPAGSGGMGTVYRARDRSSGQWVALKLMDRPSDAGRFAREARILSELSHPHIVSHVAHGEGGGGQPFLAMEWLEGHDLAQRLARGPLRVPEAVDLVRRIADGLAAAHQRGVVHRDLKPSNLFLPDGSIEQVKVLDFGIARRLAASRALTASGLIVGTPAYMAPEQARGEREITPAADVFSLGCVLYECLTGETPFSGTNLAALLMRILLEEPVPVQQRRPEVPQSLAGLISRMLAKHPGGRPDDAGALRAALAELGPLPDEPRRASVAVAPGPAAFARSEQRLLSVVLAAPPRGGPGGAPTLVPDEEDAWRVRVRSLDSALRSLGAQVSILLDDSVVVTLPQSGSALDQVEMAVRAALLIRESWPEVQVAIATGRGTAERQMAVGEVVERASRLLLDEPGEPAVARPAGPPAGIRLDELSARLLEHRFPVTPMQGGHVLMDREQAGDESRPLLGRPTPCVGREAELRTLEACLDYCVEESEARAILCTAPPGMGKSRLWHEFRRRIEQREPKVTLLLGRGELMSAGTPYGCLGGAVRRLCGLGGGERLEVQRQRLSERIGRHVPPAERQRVVLFVAELSGVAFPVEGEPMLQAALQDPRIMRDRLHRAFLDWLAAECQAAPVLLALDDLQWGDGLTLCLLDEALQELRSAPLCLLGLGRPELHETFPKLWQQRKVQEVALRGLGRKACERLIQQVLGAAVAPAVAARIIEQSAGNALFLEELIRAAAAGRSEEPPETVLAMLQARIGWLEVEPRRALLAASVYGQTFWAGGVTAVLGGPGLAREAAGWLAALEAAEVIKPRADSRLAAEREYGFRHPLVSEAAYALLTEQDAAIGHRIASTYLEQAGETDAGVLAEHAQRGGDLARATVLYVRAAEQSHGRSDLRGVLARSESGIACGAAGQALGRLRALQSVAYTWTEEWPRAFAVGTEALDLLPAGSPGWLEAIRHLFVITGNLSDPSPIQRLTGLLAAVDPLASEPRAYLQAASYPTVMFSLVGLRPPARLFLDRMRQADPALLETEALTRGALGTAAGWFYYMLEPEPYLAVSSAQQAAAALLGAGDRRLACVAQMVLGLAQIALGDPAAGQRTLRENLVLALALAEPFNITMAELYLMQGLASTPADLEEADQLAFSILGRERNARPIMVGSARGVRTRHLLRQGRYEEAQAEGDEALEVLRPLPPYRVPLMGDMVHGLLLQGRPAAARRLAEEALQIVGTCGGLGFCEVAAHVAAAEARRADGDAEDGQAALQEALAQLALRAGRIPDEAARQRFLTAVPANARALELSRAWRS